MFVCLYGMPGSGKGSQAKILSEKFDLLHISTGDLIRDIIKEKKSGYEKLEEFVVNGKLIPDEIITEILKNYISENYKNKKGILFDGYPRTINQYNLLYDYVKENFREILHNIYIKTDEEIVKKRILGRRICSECGKIYNIYNDGDVKKCSICREDLIIRKDDSEDIFYKRMKEFNNFTKPLLEFLEIKGNLFSVDGNYISIEELSKIIIDYLSK